MPLGAFKLNSIARYIVQAAPEGGVTLDAISFENNEYLYNSNIPNATANKQLTVSLWTKVYNKTPRTVSFGVRGTSRLSAGVFQYQSGLPTFRVYCQTYNETIDRTSSEVGLYTPGTWNHFVWSIDFSVDNRIQGYINGNPVTFTGFTASSYNSNIPWDSMEVFEINGYDTGTNLNKIDVAQVWVSNVWTDLSTNVSKFYDDGPVNMGSDGTASGLSQPLIYHYGNLSSFTTNGGTLSYSLTTVGSPDSITGPTELTNWNDWDEDNIGTTKLRSPDIAHRDFRTLDSFVDNEFFVIGALDSNRSTYKIYKYTISDNTISYDSETTISRTSEDISFTNCQTINLPLYDKALFFNSNTYYVLTYSSGSISMSAKKTGSTSIGNSGVTQSPIDVNKFIRFGDTGICQLVTFANSTDTCTFGTATAAISNAKSGTGFWTKDTNGTYKFAYLYFDTSALSWKIKHFSNDLSSSTTITLNSASNPAGNMAKFHNNLHKINQALMVVDDNTNMPCFSVSYDGSNFTMSDIINLTMPSATYNYVRAINGIRYLGNDVWAVSAHTHNQPTETARQDFCGLIKASSNTPVLLDWIEVTNPGLNANVRGGLALCNNGSILINVTDSVGITAGNNINLNLIYR